MATGLRTVLLAGRPRTPPSTTGNVGRENLANSTLVWSHSLTIDQFDNDWANYMVLGQLGQGIDTLA